MRGLSRTNHLYMRAFAEAYPDERIVQQAVGQIPRGHNTVLLDRLKDTRERDWYARKVIEHGWSRNVLVHQIDSRLYLRQGQRSPTSSAPCRRRSPIWRRSCSRIRTISTSWSAAPSGGSATSIAHCSPARAFS